MNRKQKVSDADNGFATWGGYMEAKKMKLLEQFKAESSKGVEHSNGIFKGVAIFVNGYTVPPADELKRIMATHGGEYHQYESNRTTHIIASNLPDCKVKKLKLLNVVKPEWIVDSLKANKLLDYRLYLLYSNRSKTQQTLQFTPNAEEKRDCAIRISDVTVAGSNDAELSCSKHYGINMSESKCNLASDHSEPFVKTCDIIKCSTVSLVNGVTDTCLPLSRNDGCSSVSSKCRNDVYTKDHKNTVRTAVDSGFLSEFYNNSRLHHLSTMGAEFKQYVNKLREKSDKTYPGRVKLMVWKKSFEPSEILPDDACGLNFDYSTSLEEGIKPVTDICDMKSRKVIMHIDMDCFFVSVGLRNRPDLIGFPVSVTHARGNMKHKSNNNSSRKFEFDYYRERRERKLKQIKEQVGIVNLNLQKENDTNDSTEERAWYEEIEEHDSMSEIASCNYEARKAGVKNGMFLGTALRLCPNLKTIPYDFDGYKEVSVSLYDIVASYTLNIEAVSCDEMYVDCTDVLKETNATPLEFASFLRKEIKEKTGCPASTGFGSNPLQARLATKVAKPDGQFYLEPTKVSEFFQNIKVEDIPGIGNTLSYRLHGRSIKTCADLQKVSLALLKKEFGAKTGETLYNHCRGIDERALETEHQRKSVSADVNYGIRFQRQDEAEVFIKQLSQEVSTRLQKVGMKGRCITLKLLVRAKDAPTETAKFMGHGVCDQITKSSTLRFAVDDSTSISREVLATFHQLQVVVSDLRGIGIQISRLENISKMKSSSLSRFLVDKPKNKIKNLSLGETSCESAANYNNETIIKEERACFQTSAVSTIHSRDNLDIYISTLSSDNSIKKSTEELSACNNDSLSKMDEKNNVLVGTDSVCNSEECKIVFQPCDIDRSVLAELPKDIQDEINEYIKKFMSQRSPEVNLGEHDPTGTVTGRSHDEMRSLSLSQIEPSFLSALPDDVCKDLKEELEKIKGRKHETNPWKASSASIKVKQKSKQTGKNQKGSKYMANFACGLSEHVHDEKNLSESSYNPADQCIATNYTCDMFDSSMNINELRTMVKDWVATESEPKTTDVQMFSEFLCHMIDEQLEKVDLLLKCLYRCISRKKTCKWQNAYHLIVSQVQCQIVAIYEMKLKLPKQFTCEDGCMIKREDLSND